MSKSYTKNYLKIYLWQGISLVLNFVSMFVVIPFLTSDPITYGVYSVCISFSIFLAYADLGFLGAGQKFAAEYFAKGDKDAEIKVIGFTTFILALFLIFFAIGFLLLSQQPQLLVKGIDNINQEKIASSLLLILAIFTPTTLLQRMLQLIFGIRLEDFIIQRNNIVGNLLKIISVLWFFRLGKYDIIGYFFFTQLINLLIALLTLTIAKKRYQYDFKTLIMAIRFNTSVFNKTKGLALVSLFLTVSWILYYEMDTIAIGKFIGVNQVAIYAIGLTILSFFRSIFGILFSPFNIRFNHFIGHDNDEGLKAFVFQVVVALMPVVTIPILAIAIYAKPLILTWVGSEYLKSIEIAQYLIFCNFFAFISYPMGMLLMAKEQQKKIYIIATLLPVIFWIGILSTVGVLGLKSFAIFKLVAFLLSFIVYYYLMLQYLQLSLWFSIKKIVAPILFPMVFLILSSVFIIEYLPTEKSKINLLSIAGTIGILIFMAFIIQYFSSSSWRRLVSKTVKSFVKA